jgi:hypothetical protein
MYLLLFFEYSMTATIIQIAQFYFLVVFSLSFMVGVPLFHACCLVAVMLSDHILMYVVSIEKF